MTDEREEVIEILELFYLNYKKGSSLEGFWLVEKILTQGFVNPKAFKSTMITPEKRRVE